jgi:predicted flap endonuclease-1-like 5' DNA nuclease
MDSKSAYTYSYTSSSSSSSKSKLDLNEATFEDLTDIKGIGKVLADKIMMYKPYNSFSDLACVPGIGPVLQSRIKDQFDIGTKNEIKNQTKKQIKNQTENQIKNQTENQIKNQTEKKVKSTQVDHTKNTKKNEFTKTKEYHEKKSYVRNSNVSSSKNKNLPKPLRTTVWRRYASATHLDALCFCCKEIPISSENFFCGHVRSRKNKGTDDLTNLRPICGTCNSSMRSDHMFEYMIKNKLRGVENLSEEEKIKYHEENQESASSKDEFIDRLFLMFEKLDLNEREGWFESLQAFYENRVNTENDKYDNYDNYDKYDKYGK